MKSAGNVFEVDKGGTLTLTDCKGSSSISHSDVEWGRGVLVSNGTFNMYGSKICNNKCSSKYQANGAGVEVDKGTLICMVARLVETKFQAWWSSFCLDTLICMVAVLPAILHNISVAVYLCIRGHLICLMVRLAAIR